VSTLGEIPTGADTTFPQEDVPDSTTIQTSLYYSWSAAFLTASFAMFHSQLLNSYALVEIGELFVNHSRDQRREMNRMVIRRCHTIMAYVHMALHSAILFFFRAYSDYYYYFVNKQLASVFIGFTIVMFILSAIVCAPTLIFPFQASPSRIRPAAPTL
jgi:hypothetical protein